MEGSFVFGRRSSLDFGLKIKSKNILTAAKAEIEEYAPPGADGTIYRYTGRRENVQIAYEAFFRAPKDEVIRRVGEIKLWLLAKPGEYLRLEDSYDPEHYRLAVFSGELEPGRDTPVTASQTLKFSCKPYRYCKRGEIPAVFALEPYTGTPVSSSLTLYNTTGYDARPIFNFGLVRGNLEPTVTIKIEYESGEVCTCELEKLGQEQSSAVLDSEEQLIFHGDGTVNNYNLLDSFPVLRPGENKITITGNRLRTATVTPRWREL